ncbi:hypothetical protein QQS21_012328 [Conoideocrella luteorostrata]|uniref:Uncharacterized protein n=1 Tax=Conoideocrella luteorostrata TaxID=1105319 RepID=A0AAJ0FUZ1_9HYPO|nr:hypothetical protein QQS21_012328 [Conoideocrella luteorostrata]
MKGTVLKVGTGEHKVIIVNLVPVGRKRRAVIRQLDERPCTSVSKCSRQPALPPQELQHDGFYTASSTRCPSNTGKGVEKTNARWDDVVLTGK